MAWAQSLLAAEAANESASPMPVAIRVSERLRVTLTRLIGADGFTAIHRRALTLARTNVPLLQTVSVLADGRLKGLEDIDEDGDGAGSAITAHLLDLLATFIGESAALRIVSDAFPHGATTMSRQSEDFN